MLWASEEETKHWYHEALRHATVAVGNRDEVEMAVGTDGPLDASAALLDLGLELAVVKQGPRGCHVVSTPPGYDLYYLNVMAGPVREWKMKNDPEHEWLLG